MSNHTLDEYQSSGVECPTCGGEYKSEHGVKVHHKRVHGESIAGVEVECHWCGKEYREKEYRVEERDRLFCSRDCMGEWNSENRVGKNATNYKGGQSVECKVCGESFWASPSDFERDSRNPTYCSPQCRGEDFKERYAGKGNPRWDGGLPEHECEVCGDIFKRQSKDANRFCSVECMAKWQADEYSGQGNPHWLGGIVNYGPGWGVSKSQEIKKRDQARCVDCGVLESQTTPENYHHVHHICGARSSSNPAVYNAKRNLVTLCVHCHREWERHSPGVPPDSNYYERTS